MIADGADVGGGGRDEGQGDGKDGASAAGASAAAHLQFSAVLDHDAQRHPQSEAGSLFSLGSEERFEEAAAIFGGNAGAVVGDEHANASDAIGGRAAFRRTMARQVVDANLDTAAAADGVGGVEDEIGEDLRISPATTAMGSRVS